MSYEYPVGMGPDFIPYNQYNYLCIPKLAMPQLVAEFVKLLELEKTNKFCSCEWVVHPADMGLAEGMRRVRKGEPALDCMVHTKEGFLLGFTHWLFYMRNQEPEPVRVPDIELPPFVISLLTDAERLCNEGKITTKLRDIMWEEQIGYVPTDEQRKAALPKSVTVTVTPHDPTQIRYVVGEQGPELLPIAACGHTAYLLNVNRCTSDVCINYYGKPDPGEDWPIDAGD